MIRKYAEKMAKVGVVDVNLQTTEILLVLNRLLWAPAQRKRATVLYFANVFYLFFFMAALFSGPGERRFAKVLHVVDLECH